MTSTTPYRLSRAQLDSFNREGYLVVEELFTDAELQPVIDELSREVDHRARELAAAGELPRTYAEDDFEHRLARISLHTPKVAFSIWDGTLSGPAIFELIRNSKLLDVAEQMCGPELIASAVYRLRPKVPQNDYGAVPWHQDSGYLEPYCDNTLMLTVWLPLVDATVENGCMWVMPRVHTEPVLEHQTRPGKPYLVIPPEALPLRDTIPVPVKKRGVLLLT
ncbi:MAG TPA: phytanoyl-CoA dioxygenase family protein, partial [Tepidisphaeraceae bacterium]